MGESLASKLRGRSWGSDMLGGDTLARLGAISMSFGRTSVEGEVCLSLVVLCTGGLGTSELLGVGSYRELCDVSLETDAV